MLNGEVDYVGSCYFGFAKNKLPVCYVMLCQVIHSFLYYARSKNKLAVVETFYWWWLL